MFICVWVECDGAGSGGVVVFKSGLSDVMTVLKVLMVLVVGLDLRVSFARLYNGRVGEFSFDEYNFFARRITSLPLMVRLRVWDVSRGREIVVVDRVVMIGGRKVITHFAI